VWLSGHRGLAVKSRETYEYVVKNQVLPALKAVRLREIRPAVITRALTAIAAESGPGSAKTARTVLAGMFDLAVADDAMQANPARGLRIGSGRARKSTVHALTPGQVDEIADSLRSSQRAMALDLPDLVEWMLGTGMRIGEACAMRASVLRATTAEVDATAVRVKGVGLVVQERPKSAAGWRVLALPQYLVAMLERRAAELRLHARKVTFLNDRDEYRLEADPGIAFPSPNGHLRDPSNTAGDLREARDAIGREDEEQTGPYGWVTSHVFRKTVATRLDEAGLSARQIADQLGHAKPSMTQDDYVGRKVVSAEAARILNR
jgi:integrase